MGKNSTKPIIGTLKRKWLRRITYGPRAWYEQEVHFPIETVTEE